MSALSTFIGGAGGAKLWVSGLVVKQWETVKSPADGELYTRKTATGGGTTDPADDVTNYFAASFERCGAMVAKPTAAFVPGSPPGQSLYAYGIARVQPGVVPIGTRTLLHSQTGRGTLAFLGTYKQFPGTFRFEVIVDGRTVLDGSYQSTANNTTLTLLGNVASGTVPGGTAATQEAFGYPDLSGPKFRRSLQIYVTATVTRQIEATDAFAIATRSEA